MKSNAAIFLDRDGIINESIVISGKPYAPKNLDEFKIIPGVAAVLCQLKEDGFILVVISNQPDVARGTIVRETVELMHELIRQQMPIDSFETCFHDDIDCCTCRKPKPGAILNAVDKLNIDLSKSFLIGDRWKDMEAGRAAGCKTIFFDYGYDEPSPTCMDYTITNLAEAIQIIHQESKGL